MDVKVGIDVEEGDTKLSVGKKEMSVLIS